MKELKELFVHELKDMLDAEERMVDALGKMSKNASDPEVRQALEEHREETENQAERLRKVFKALGKRPGTATCAGMSGIIKEHRTFEREEEPSAAISDFYTLISGMKAERYEITAYETLVDVAERLELGDRVVGPLEENLMEEQETFEKLRSLMGDFDVERAGGREPARREKARGKAARQARPAGRRR